MEIKMYRGELNKCMSELKDLRLVSFNLACEMMIFDFEKYAIHSQCLTRIIKNDDILFTTLDYQNWDEENDKNNDEWFFKDKYCDEIVGGCVVSVELNALNDVKIVLDNTVTIEMFISNGYYHYAEENEQWRLIKLNPEYKKDMLPKMDVSLFHLVVNNKMIEKFE
ncbi:MAG: hypothetical protein NC393_12665 [Clostridium sp.]|nr:hypothetical protein [Clostridium sp.]MCM1172962.1 hypothetical protein [Clostridium sp.]MCM1209186.1 hypothetical protein [Ruminococcus sp.]